LTQLRAGPSRFLYSLKWAAQIRSSCWLGALDGEGKPESLADALYKSVTMGVGQFCTCPGLVFGVESPQFAAFIHKLAELFEQATPGTMLNPGIAKNYRDRFENAAGVKDVRAYKAERLADSQRTEGRPGVLVTGASTWLRQETLREEIFGPATVVVRCSSEAELLACAKALSGTLTATLHGTPADLSRHLELVNFPHGKSWPAHLQRLPHWSGSGPRHSSRRPLSATTDAKFTSVGAAAIYRFARPVCYQNFPEALLPPELQNANPRGIWRRIDGQLTKNALS